MRRVAVTGATGFVGRHLVGSLARAGWQVRLLATDAGSADWMRAQDLPVEAATGDVRAAAQAWAG